MLNRILSLTLVAAGLLAGGQNASAALVTNGGFETGTLNGWSLSGDGGFTGVDTGAAYDGSYAFYSGSSGGATLSQSLATTSGGRYQLSFWLQNGSDGTGAAAPNMFSVRIGGVELLSLSDSISFGYTQYRVDFAALGTSTDLAFTFQHSPAFWDLDNVTASAVPEPATAVLVGLAGLAAFSQTRRRKAA